MTYTEYLQFKKRLVFRGAMFLSMKINPDFGFGLDTTIGFDTPGNKKEQVSALR